jgi:hypothetical protein
VLTISSNDIYRGTDQERCITDDFDAIEADIAEIQEALANEVCGTYVGDGKTSHFIELGFTPSVVFIIREDGMVGDGKSVFGGIITATSPIKAGTLTAAQISDNGFTVNSCTGSGVNTSTYTYRFYAK